MITVKLDATLIDKSKLFPGKKPNKKGVCPQYLDLVLIELRNGPDQYGNTHIVKQSQTKEERESGKEMPIIGNAKEFQVQRAKAKPEIERMRKNDTPKDSDLPPDDVPF